MSFCGNCNTFPICQSLYYSLYIYMGNILFPFDWFYIKPSDLPVRHLQRQLPGLYLIFNQPYDTNEPIEPCIRQSTREAKNVMTSNDIPWCRKLSEQQIWNKSNILSILFRNYSSFVFLNNKGISRYNLTLFFKHSQVLTMS